MHLPIDRCRALLLPFGRPGLGPGRRPAALAATVVAGHLARLEPGLCLPAPAWATVQAVVWCWHDHLEQARAGAPPPVRLVCHRRLGRDGEAQADLAACGRHPAWARLVPVVAAEGLGERLLDGQGFQAEAFLRRCWRPGAGEAAALERIQAAELLAVLAWAVRA